MTTNIHDFIDKAARIHDNKYDYSEVVYKGVNVPVDIICPVHGVFSSKPVTHTTKRSGCPKCGRASANAKKQKSQQQFIEDAVKVHGNVYDYSKAIYVNNHTPVTITCRIHGDFEQMPVKHTSQKCGCPRCAKVMNITDFVSCAIATHGDRYGYDMVVYVNSRTHVQVVCPDHGVFNITPNNHLNGYGCPTCGRSKNIGGYCHSTLSGTATGSIPGVLYLVQGEDEGGLFYKVGITKHGISKRFGAKAHDFAILATRVGTLYECFCIEQHILTHMDEYRCRPTHMIQNGATECFRCAPDHLDWIIDTVMGTQTSEGSNPSYTE